MTENKSTKRGLGRGLSALMADVAPPEALSVGDAVGRQSETMVPIENIHANPDQPRRRFDNDSLQELASSIAQRGVLQPLIVRNNPRQPNGYEIVAGERRWRAAQMARLHELPVVVRSYSDNEVLEIAIIENVQRTDLNPVEEATGYRQLMDRFGHTQEKLAEALSKSRSHIANLMRLLQLPDDVLEYLRGGQLSAGHARALITSDDPSGLARRVVAGQLSVRETERLAKTAANIRPQKGARKKQKDADTRALEKDLSANLQLKVSIDHKSTTGGGQVVIRYKDMDELDQICRVLSAT
ncbi:MAG: ParB/RepB/Spo0J family partition protein [Paracoccaceae bacterium]